MVIVDTSVIFKWFGNNEEKRESAKAILKSHLEKKEVIIIPDLFLYEITNAWSTKTALTIEDIDENLAFLQTYDLHIQTVNYSLIIKAVNFSKKYRVTVYDAIYAVLAGEKDCVLITADEKFVSQVNLASVKLLE